MAIYVVGDLQGCYSQISKLLDKVNFDPATDRLWSVGDLVNRGPKSLKTLRFLYNLGDCFTAVLGNHDLHLLAIAKGAFTQGKKDHLEKVLAAPDCEQLCEWLRQLPLMHAETVDTRFGAEKCLLFHAGLAPDWSAEQALAYAREVETVLRGDEHFTYLQNMYGDTPDTWNDNLQGMERLRVITNYLTRARFCNRKGKLELKVKTGASTAPAGYRPWFEYQTLSPEHVILFGHWAALEGVTNMPNVYALDTGCVWGRSLTMLRLEDRQVFSVSCSGLRN